MERSLFSRDAETIRGVSFDLGGTLIAPTPSVGGIYAMVCAAHGVDVDPGRCDRAFEVAWSRRSAAAQPGTGRFSATEDGEDGWWRRVILEVLQECGIPASMSPPLEAFRDAFASPRAWRVFEDVEETLAALKSAGYGLAIVSNWDSRMPRLLGTLGLAGYFDAVLCSAEAGVEKPDPRIFEMAAEALGLPAEQILHVGDLAREDYHGARGAGMKALIVNRDGNGARGPEDVDSAHVVRSIGEVRGRLLGDRDGRASGSGKI